MIIDKLVSRIKDNKIIYLGEFHDNYTHHSIQLEIIGKLYEVNNKIAVGMEMFQAKFQPVIDEFIQGRITENQMVERTEYRKRWGFDYSYYKSLLCFFREKEIRVIALNMDSEIIQSVSGYDPLTLSYPRSHKLPDHIDFSNEQYKQILFGIYSESPTLFYNNFYRFYNLQIIRDEGMAEIIDRFLTQNPDFQIIILAGNGHIMYSHGIPSRVYNRNNIEFVTILSDMSNDPGIADFVINTGSVHSVNEVQSVQNKVHHTTA